MGRVVDRSGCKSCPRYPKCNALYRGMFCLAMRSSYGLGDPITNGQKIRNMSDIELAKRNVYPYYTETIGKYEECWRTSDGSTFWEYDEAFAYELKWLKEIV